MGKRRGADSGPSSRLIKGAGFLIGLATELHAHYKAKKSGSQSTEDQSQQTVTLQHKTRSRIDDEPPAYDEARTAESLLNSDTAMTDMSSTYIEKPLMRHPLPYPVILPQRRPNDKSRGFVRAYAPDLGKYKGIDEPTFLGFLKDFHKSSQASGIFHIINIAALGAGFAPSLIATAVSVSVKTASRAAEEAHSRYRTNAYLDKANKDLFHPRNLHCMIMTFKPEVGENALLNFNVNSGSMTGVREGRRKDASSDRRQSKESSHGLLGGVKNMMQQDVLYLLVAEIPSEHEMNILTSEM